MATVLAKSEIRDSREGAAIIEFDAGSAGQINAYLHVLDSNRSLSFTFPFMGDEANAAGPLEAVAWYYTRNANACFALQNTTDQAITVMSTIFESDRTFTSEEIALKPNGIATILIPAEKDIQTDETRTPKAIGIRIESIGKPGAVVAQGWIMDEGIGFSAPFTFRRSSGCECGDDIQHQYGTGIMIGQGGMMDPNIIFTPYLALSNNANQE